MPTTSDQRVSCEAMEARQLLADSSGAIEFRTTSSNTTAGAADLHLTNATPITLDTQDPEAVKKAGGTVVLIENGTAAAVFGAAGTSTSGRRTGIFNLPTVRSDGSIDITGTSETDVISAERTTGVHEPSDEDGNDDHEFNFVNIIGSDGKRVILPYVDSMPADSNTTYIEHLISDIQNNVDQPNPLPLDSKGEVVYEYNLPLLQKQLADARLKQAALTTGDFTRYTLESVYDYYVQNDPAIASKATIRVDGGAGSDSINISSNVTQRTKLSGGSGADKIISGTRHADLFGGGGNDSLISRSTRGGTMDGGKGSDRYFNRAAGAGEIKVLGRNDGDRIVSGAAAVPIKTAGLFGNSTIQRQSYFLLSDSDGQVDLLA